MPTYMIAYTINAVEAGKNATDSQIRVAATRREKMNAVMTTFGAKKLGEQTCWWISTSTPSAEQVWAALIQTAKAAGNEFKQQDWIGVYEVNMNNVKEG